MNQENIQKFDEIADKLLAFLGKSFPIPVNIGPESLDLEMSEKGLYDPVSGEPLEGEPLTEDESYFEPTVDWFYKSGYIHANHSTRHSGYYGLVLTEKGLALLGIKPSSLSAK